MTIREARALKPGDAVFIFYGNRRIQAKVVMVEKKGPQRVEIELEFKDSFGETNRVQRLQTSAYLTKETAAQLFTRGPQCPGREPHTILNPCHIPGDIIRCAIQIDNWMKMNKHERWKLMAIQSRED